MVASSSSSSSDSSSTDSSSSSPRRDRRNRGRYRESKDSVKIREKDRPRSKRKRRHRSHDASSSTHSDSHSSSGSSSDSEHEEPSRSKRHERNEKTKKLRSSFYSKYHTLSSSSADPAASTPTGQDTPLSTPQCKLPHTSTPAGQGTSSSIPTGHVTSSSTPTGHGISSSTPKGQLPHASTPTDQDILSSTTAGQGTSSSTHITGDGPSVPSSSAPRQITRQGSLPIDHLILEHLDQADDQLQQTDPILQPQLKQARLRDATRFVPYNPRIETWPLPPFAGHHNNDHKKKTRDAWAAYRVAAKDAERRRAAAEEECRVRHGAAEYPGKNRGNVDARRLVPPDGKRVVLEWSAGGDPVGPWASHFTQYLGCMARRSNYFNIVLAWREQKFDNFVACWREIQRHFDLSGNQRAWVTIFDKIEENLKQWRAKLKRKYYVKVTEDCERFWMLDDRVDVIQFFVLCERWDSPDAKKISAINKLNREVARPYEHHGGSRSFAQHAYVLAQEEKTGLIPLVERTLLDFSPKYLAKDPDERERKKKKNQAVVDALKEHVQHTMESSKVNKSSPLPVRIQSEDTAVRDTLGEDRKGRYRFRGRQERLYSSSSSEVASAFCGCSFDDAGLGLQTQLSEMAQRVEKLEREAAQHRAKEARRAEEEAKRHEEEARCMLEEAQRLREDAQRHELEMRRLHEAMEAQRQSENWQTCMAGLPATLRSAMCKFISSYQFSDSQGQHTPQHTPGTQDGQHTRHLAQQGRPDDV